MPKNDKPKNDKPEDSKIKDVSLETNKNDKPNKNFKFPFGTKLKVKLVINERSKETHKFLKVASSERVLIKKDIPIIVKYNQYIETALKTGVIEIIKD